MKGINYVIVSLIFLLCTSCYSSQKISMFSKSNVEIGMDKKIFIKEFGKPYSRNICKNENGENQEILFYKEELNKGTWYLVTTSFTFIDSKLVEQKFVKEERMFNNNCKCNK